MPPPGAGSARTLMVDLTMPQETVRLLAEGNYRLCLFHAVECDQGGGSPLVWATTASYAPSTTLSWQETTYAYASTDEPVRDTVVTGRSFAKAGPGQVVDVASNALASVAPVQGESPYITVRNLTGTPFSCGLAQSAPAAREAPAPYCAFPLYGNNLVFVAPLPRVALTFTTRPLYAGSPVDRVLGPTVLVDLERACPAGLRYDINAGWSADGPYAAPIPLDAFRDSLIVPSRDPAARGTP
ncbi:hypothetical protein GCM10010420_21900 [Streptomyces glaucosporus]|uniref:DUF4232 domain-containing protein n=1 Tax=Streptomyces glaucosporus TaxID=284044 RepID=A0ABP5VCS7_9ACTN